jgi:hypothetical protein
MTRTFAGDRRRLMLLVVTLGLVAVALLQFSPPAAALICGPNSVLGRKTEYFSGPEFKKMVGECTDCLGEENCTGQQTAYSFTIPTCCLDD